MSNKKTLVILLALLIIVPTAITYAEQSSGMASGTGPSLPGGIQASINPEGLGDSLLYGYYNVRGNLNLVNVVNTSPTDGAKARVVFRNAKTGVDCFEFSVCLKAGDVWTGFLIDNGTTAALCPLDDDTLTSPLIPASCQQFNYEGAGGKTGVTADDCREGYFEVVGMMSIPDYKVWDTSPPVSTEIDCRDYAAGADLGNVLMGNNSIFNLSTLETFSYDATAVADARLSPLTTTDAIDAGGFPLVMDKGCPEADYIFMKSSIISPYNVMPEIGGETEIIVTFPTRLACHADPASPDKPRVPQPFPQFDAYGNDFYVGFGWDLRSNNSDIMNSSCEIICVPRVFHHALNVIKIGIPRNIWDSRVAYIINVSPFEIGWINIGFDIDYFNGSSYPNHTLTYGSTPSRTALGLPALAYTTQSFVGGAASYMKPAKYQTDIQ